MIELCMRISFFVISEDRANCWYFICRTKENGENTTSSNDSTYVDRAASPSNATTVQGITIPSSESQNFLPAHLKYTTPDQNPNVVPPYMPIQGIRRANGVAQSEKKKKTKDNRCTHQ